MDYEVLFEFTPKNPDKCGYFNAFVLVKEGQTIGEMIVEAQQYLIDHISSTHSWDTNAPVAGCDANDWYVDIGPTMGD